MFTRALLLLLHLGDSGNPSDRRRPAATAARGLKCFTDGDSAAAAAAVAVVGDSHLTGLRLFLVLLLLQPLLPASAVVADWPAGRENESAAATSAATAAIAVTSAAAGEVVSSL
jgi:hypothetical protein